MFIDSMEFIENILKDRKKLTVLILFIFLPVVLSLILTNFDVAKNLFPKSLAPQKEVKIEYTPQPAVESNLQVGPYRCPSVPNFCTNSQEIIKNDKYEGVGADLPPGSPIYAAFDGELTALLGKVPTENGEEEIAIIYLDNKKRGLRAVYILKDKVPEPKTVKEGDTIARVGDKINLYGVSLVFKLIKGDPLLGEVVKLKAEDFK